MSRGGIELTTEILDRFRAALNTAGAPLGDAIGPGLSDEEIDEVGAQLGTEIPRELRTLWAWGQPSAANVDPNAGGWDINPRFELWPAADAVETTRIFRTEAPERDRHIAFAGPPQDDCLMVTSDDLGATVSVIYALVEADSLDLVPSLGALFSLWSDQLEAGDYKFSGGRWESIDGPLPFVVLDR